MKKYLIILLSVMIFTSSCANQEFVTSYDRPSSQEFKEDQTFFVGGIFQANDTDATRICRGPHRVAKVSHTESPLNVAIKVVQSIFLFGFMIYTPREASVNCK